MKYSSIILSLLVLVFPSVVSADIDSEPVRRDVLNETIQLDGLVEATQESTVSAQTSGTIQHLPYDVDDSVRAGDLIVKIEDSQQQALLNQARGSVEEVEAAYQDAMQQFDRVKETYAQGFVSRQQFDQAENNLAAVKARLERARAGLEEAQQQVEYTRVVAPYSGILTERHVEVGETVAPGQALLSGLSLEQLRVVVEVPQRYADKVREQRTASVTVADGRVLQTGQMTLYPYASATTHTFRLRLALIEPEATIYPGMLVKVQVPVASRTAIWIPESSLIQRSELLAVYVLDAKNKPRLRQIRTGVRKDGRFEVLAGLEEGERVVINPMSLSDGSASKTSQAKQVQKEESRG